MNLLPVALVAGVLWVCHHHIHRNPSAEADSFDFHGDSGHVRHGRMVIGKVRSITYEAPRGSKRAGLWRHEFGDGGRFAPSSKQTPLLVEKSGRLALVQGKSPTHFDSRFGIVQ